MNRQQQQQQRGFSSGGGFSSFSDDSFSSGGGVKRRRTDEDQQQQQQEGGGLGGHGFGGQSDFGDSEADTSSFGGGSVEQHKEWVPPSDFPLPQSSYDLNRKEDKDFIMIYQNFLSLYDPEQQPINVDVVEHWPGQMEVTKDGKVAMSVGVRVRITVGNRYKEDIGIGTVKKMSADNKTYAEQCCYKAAVREAKRKIWEDFIADKALAKRNNNNKEEGDGKEKEADKK